MSLAYDAFETVTSRAMVVSLHSCLRCLSLRSRWGTAQPVLSTSRIFPAQFQVRASGLTILATSVETSSVPTQEHYSR